MKLERGIFDAHVNLLLLILNLMIWSSSCLSDTTGPEDTLTVGRTRRGEDGDKNPEQTEGF